MNTQARALADSAEPCLAAYAAPPTLRLVKPPQPPAAVVTVPADALLSEAPKPAGLLHTFWQLLFGPPKIDVRAARTDFGVFRAMYEVGSDYLPSSGTWPTP